MTSFPRVAPSAVTKTMVVKLPRLTPVAASSAVAISVYDAPKKAVAFATNETRNMMKRRSRTEINRMDSLAPPLLARL